MLNSELPRWVRFLLWFAAPEVLPTPRRTLYVVRVAHETQLVIVGGAVVEPRCSCGFVGPHRVGAEAELVVMEHRAQAFFADIALEMRRPSFGEMAASTMQSLLNRAIEAKLYTPEKP